MIHMVNHNGRLNMIQMSNMIPMLNRNGRLDIIKGQI